GFTNYLMEVYRQFLKLSICSGKSCQVCLRLHHCATTFPDDQLSWQQDSLCRRNTPVDQVDQTLHRQTAQVTYRLANCAQRRLYARRSRKVVKAHNGNVPWNRQALLVQRSDRSNGNEIAPRKDGIYSNRYKLSGRPIARVG